MAKELVITSKTRFDTIKKRYPDALKGVFETDKPLFVDGTRNMMYGIGKEAKCLYQNIAKQKKGYKCTFIFSVQALKEIVE